MTKLGCITDCTQWPYKGLIIRYCGVKWSDNDKDCSVIFYMHWVMLQQGHSKVEYPKVTGQGAPKHPSVATCRSYMYQGNVVDNEGLNLVFYNE